MRTAMLTADEPQLDNPAPPTLNTRKLVMALHELATRSQKMFGPSVTIESMHDPDDPQSRKIVFHVTASGDSDRQLHGIAAEHHAAGVRGRKSF